MSRIKLILFNDEGIKLRVYDDKTGLPVGPGSTLVGHPTVGIGRALDTQGLSRAESLYLLDNDIGACRLSAEVFHWFSGLSEVRQDVVLSMIFQLGMAGFCAFKKMIDAIENRDFKTAAAEMVDSEWGTQARERSNRLAAMMASGEYPEGVSNG